MATNAVAVSERKRWAPAFDRPLVFTVAALLILGLAMVYSTTFDWSAQQYGNPLNIWSKQALWLVFGLALLTLMYKIDYRFLHKLSIPMMGVTIVMLIAVLIVGKVVFGANRTLVGASVQPGEIAKFASIVYLADWLSSKGKKLGNLTYGFIPFAVVVGILASLIVLEPDLSMAIVVVLVAMTLFFVAGADWKQFTLGLMCGTAAFVIVVPRFTHAQSRLSAYLGALKDPSLASWHMQQVLIAIGSGGLLGEGLGTSVQKFGNLPTPHTDSVFAVIGEELGLVGCVLIVVLFALLAYRGFRIARYAPDGFSALLATGITCSILYEAIVNVSVMTGLIPFTGLPLPFISYGGSSLVTALTGVGILLSISRVSQHSPGKRSRNPGTLADARDDVRRGNRRARVPRFGRR